MSEPTQLTTQWCKRHESIISNAGEVCQAAINIAYRTSVNSFDPYNRRSIGKCQFVRVRIVEVTDNE